MIVDGCSRYEPTFGDGVIGPKQCQYCHRDGNGHPQGNDRWKPTKHYTPKMLKWMRICHFMADELSTCAKRQYCSIILATDQSTVGVGYNGGPPGMRHCVSGGCPRMQEGSAPGSNYDNCISIHAEENAIIRSDPVRRAGGTLFVNGTPCFGCAKKICNSGVSTLVGVYDDTYATALDACDFIDRAGIRVVLLDPDLFKEFHD